MLINPNETKNDVVQWIKTYFEQNGPECCAVVGISGGKDSAVVAALCVEALGAVRVFGVMMPNGHQSDIADARSLAELLGIRSITVNIKDAYNILRNRIRSAANILLHTEQADINLAPRLRMATLYFVAQSLPTGGRVANTCNFSEDYIGYSTKFGDTAGDFGPIQGFLAHEVRQLGHAIGLPKELVDKTPADGLCGKSDEENLGFTYDMLDNFILNGSSGSLSADMKIGNLHKNNLHKLRVMPSFPSCVVNRISHEDLLEKGGAI